MWEMRWKASHCLGEVTPKGGGRVEINTVSIGTSMGFLHAFSLLT